MSMPPSGKTLALVLKNLIISSRGSWPVVSTCLRKRGAGMSVISFCFKHLPRTPFTLSEIFALCSSRRSPRSWIFMPNEMHEAFRAACAKILAATFCESVGFGPSCFSSFFCNPRNFFTFSLALSVQLFVSSGSISTSSKRKSSSSYRPAFVQRTSRRNAIRKRPNSRIKSMMRHHVSHRVSQAESPSASKPSLEKSVACVHFSAVRKPSRIWAKADRTNPPAAPKFVRWVQEQ